MYVKIKDYVSLKRSSYFESYMIHKYGLNYDEKGKDTFISRALYVVDSVLNFIYDHTINPILKRTKRKIYVRVDSYDVYSADHTIALIVLPILKKLQACKHGAPYVDVIDVPCYLRPTAEPMPGHTDDTHFDRWDWVLSEMIWAFSQIIRDDRESQFYSGETDIQFKKLANSAYSKIVTGPNHTFAVDIKAAKEYEDRIQNGLSLFAKYYHCLWT